MEVNKASGRDQEAIAQAVALAMRAAQRRREATAELAAANEELRQPVLALQWAGFSERSIATFTGLSSRQVQHITAAA